VIVLLGDSTGGAWAQGERLPMLTNPPHADPD
jgi:hypothetical protein